MTVTETTVIGIKTLIFLALRQDGDPVSPRRLAQHLGASPTYMAKICRLLVKAGLLRSHRGSTGGVTLNTSSSEVTLLAIAEACQGKILENYCSGANDPDAVCAFHRAMLELHDCIVGSLSRVTLADLAAKPEPTGTLRGAVDCRIGVPVCGFGDEKEKRTED